MIFMYTLWLFIRRPGFEASRSRRFWTSDLVDINTVDLSKDEYQGVETDRAEDERRHNRVMDGNSVRRVLWRLYYLVV